MARGVLVLVGLISLLSACSHGGMRPAAKVQVPAGAATVAGDVRKVATATPTMAPGVAVAPPPVSGTSASGLYDVGQFFVPASGQVQASNRMAMAVLKVQVGDTFHLPEAILHGPPPPLNSRPEYYLMFTTAVAGTRLTIQILGAGIPGGPGFEQVDDATYRVAADGDVVPDAYEQPDGGYKPARDHTSVVNRFGHLLIDPRPVPASAVVQYNTGEGLDVSGAKQIGTLPTDLAKYTRTFCDEHLCYLYGGDNRAPAAGTIICGDPVQLITDDFRLTFKRDWIPPGQATPVPGTCAPDARVAAGERVPMPYTSVYLRAYTLDGQPLSIVVAGDGTLYVGKITPKFSCGPCRGS